MPEALEFGREELRPSVSEAPVSIGVLNDGDDDVVLLDTAGLQFLDELGIEGCLLLLGSLPACDPDEDDVLGAIDTEHTPATVKLYLSKYRDSIRQIDPNHLVLRPRKMRSGQRFSYLALPPEETRTINAAYHQRIHKDQSNLIPLDPEAFIQTALDLLASDRYLEKGMGLMALTGRRPAEIFFSASFSLPKKKLPFPALIFEGQLKTRHAPGTSFEPYPIPVFTLSCPPNRGRFRAACAVGLQR
jgi:hypothetical protein